MSAWEKHKKEHGTAMQDACWYCADLLNQGTSSKKLIREVPKSSRNFRRLMRKGNAQ